MWSKKRPADPLKLSSQEIALKKTNIEQFIQLIFTKSYILLIELIKNVIPENLQIYVLNPLIITHAKKGSPTHYGQPIHCYTIVSTNLKFENGPDKETPILYIPGIIRIGKPQEIVVNKYWVSAILNKLVIECINSNALLENLYKFNDIIYDCDNSLIYCDYIQKISNEKEYKTVLENFPEEKFATWDKIQETIHGKPREDSEDTMDWRG